MDTTSPRRRGPAFLGGLVLLLVGVVLFGYIGWTYFGTTAVAHHEQRQLAQTLEKTWEVKPGTKLTAKQQDDLHGAFALVRVARFGKDYEVPLVKGVDDAALERGIGWEPESAEPGQEGNFIIAAHRITRGEPFRDFPSLQPGDAVTVETQSATYTYKLFNGGTSWVVDETDAWMNDKLIASQKKNAHLLTMITCSDLYHSPRRSIAVGVLTKTVEK